MELIPARQLRASKDCERLVKVSEGKSLKSYLCGANKWSIGYGSTDGVTAGMTITDAEAEILLRKDMAVAEDIVRDFFGDISMHQGMFDALTSFALNFGPKMGNYPIARMVRDPSVTDAQIAKKALEYQYTKRDDDGDGDIDAVIDAGLPIRRHREALMMIGFSFEVASHVVTRASLAMREKSIPWIGGGHKEILEAVTPFAELERKARALNAFLEEPEPIKHDLFDDEYDPTPDTPLTTKDLNHRQLERISGQKIPLTGASKRIPIEAVDYIENPEPQVKRIEDSQRGKGYAKTTTGQVVGVAAAGGVVAEQIGAVEPVINFAEKYNMATAATVFILLGFMALAWYFLGKWQRERGEDEATDLLG